MADPFLVDNFASHSTAVNALSLKCEWIRQNQNISSASFTTIKCIVSSFGPFYRPNIPFHILQLVKSLTFFYLKPKNSTPFGRSQSLIGPLLGVHPPPPLPWRRTPVSLFLSCLSVTTLDLRNMELWYKKSNCLSHGNSTVTQQSTTTMRNECKKWILKFQFFRRFSWIFTRDDIGSQLLKFGSAFLSYFSWESKIALSF